MESSETRTKVIELGDELVAQLSNPEKTDTLSRWVAHYIAEQLVQIEQTKGEDKRANEDRCFQAILTLWSHRSSMPNGMRPLEDFEPILHALDRLDPKNPRPMWHSLGHRPDEEDESTETIKTMDCILSMDRVIRELIETLLHSAVASAVNRSLGDTHVAESGTRTHLKGYGWILVFRLAAPDGDVEHWATGDLEMDELTRLKWAEWSWSIEACHRGIKQFCGVEKCQARAGRAQRNHIALALRAFVRLEVYCLHTGISWFEAKARIVREAIRVYLAFPLYNLSSTA